MGVKKLLSAPPKNVLKYLSLMMGVVLDDGPTSVDVTFDGDDIDDNSSGCVVTPLTDGACIEIDDDDDVEDPAKEQSSGYGRRLVV